MQTYTDIFNHRGHAYHAAMQQFPRARDAEFEYLFSGLDIEQFQHVLDCPAGGGYLAHYLAPGTQITAIDPSDGFIASSPSVAKIDLHQLKLDNTTFDAVVCLAALHHIEPKSSFIRSLINVTRPGGYLCIGDVLHGSKEAQFLDNFVGSFNQTGHQGAFLSADDVQLAAYAHGLATLKRVEHVACPWQFSNQDEMVYFCRHLFGMVDVENDALLDALHTQIGVSQNINSVQLDWRLLYVTYMVP